MLRKLLIPLAVLAACGGESSSGNDLEQELETTQAELNQMAREACDAPANVAELDPDDDSRSEVRCYAELSVAFDSCEKQALGADPDEARAYLACVERDFSDMLACCTRDGKCTYGAIERCYDSLWDGVSAGPCDADLTEIEAAIDRCE